MGNKIIKKWLAINVFIFFIGYTLSSQTTNKDRLQLTNGLTNTLHYNQPVTYTVCYEGCGVESQIARPAYNLDLDYYRNINKTNELFIGLGLSQNRYLETGNDFSGFTGAPDAYTPFRRMQALTFYNFHFGHRVRLKKGRRFSTFFENGLLFEKILGTHDAITQGLAYKTKLGVGKKISSTIYLHLNAVFKTGLTNYAKTSESNFSKPAYTPYGYGFDIGISKEI